MLMFVYCTCCNNNNNKKIKNVFIQVMRVHVKPEFMCTPCMLKKFKSATVALC